MTLEELINAAKSGYRFDVTGDHHCIDYITENNESVDMYVSYIDKDGVHCRGEYYDYVEEFDSEECIEVNEVYDFDEVYTLEGIADYMELSDGIKQD